MEPLYKTYKPAVKGFYKLWLLAFLLLVLAGVANYFKPGEAWLKWVWIAVVVVDVLIVLYIYAKRWTISLTLKDNPSKPDDQEVSFSECNPCKPFSSDFRKSIEIGLSNIEHIEIKRIGCQPVDSREVTGICKAGIQRPEHLHNSHGCLRYRFRNISAWRRNSTDGCNRALSRI